MTRLFSILVLFICSHSISQTSDISLELETNILGNIALGNLRSVVIGVIDDGERRYYSFGKPFDESGNGLNENTVFQIASISKTFVGILLADLVLQGDVNLETPIQQLLPASFQSARSASQITLLGLATHRSGLPRDFFPQSGNRPLTELELYNSLAIFSISEENARVGQYSNLGFSLLGLLIANKAGTSYEELLNARILRPLKLDSTTLDILPGVSPARPINMEGAGGIRSTAKDLLTYAEANMGLMESPLADAMNFSHTPRVGWGGGTIGLAWLSSNREDGTEIAHNGALSGWRSELRISKARKLGVVILARVRETSNRFDIGPYVRHIFDDSVTLSNEALKRRAIPRNFIRANYPEGLEDKSLSGFVIVEVTVNADGNVTEATITESDLGDVFDSAALAAAMKLKFNPKLENGRNVIESGIRHRFEF